MSNSLTENSLGVAFLLFSLISNFSFRFFHVEPVDTFCIIQYGM